jgi:ABC-type multidrug transport system ATPase subunit
LTKAYAGQTRPANKDITLQIDQGEIFGLLGENGAGKTTLRGSAADRTDQLALDLAVTAAHSDPAAAAEHRRSRDLCAIRAQKRWPKS